MLDFLCMPKRYFCTFSSPCGLLQIYQISFGWLCIWLPVFYITHLTFGKKLKCFLGFFRSNQNCRSQTPCFTERKNLPVQKIKKGDEIMNMFTIHKFNNFFAVFFQYQNDFLDSTLRMKNNANSFMVYIRYNQSYIKCSVLNMHQ